MFQQVCLTQHFDPLTESCSELTWVEQQSFLPSLSVQDSLLIGSAIVSCWAIGFGFKILRKYLFR